MTDVVLPVPTGSWRLNANLAKCFNDCVEIFHEIASEPDRALIDPNPGGLNIIGYLEGLPARDSQ